MNKKIKSYYLRYNHNYDYRSIFLIDRSKNLSKINGSTNKILRNETATIY